MPGRTNRQAITAAASGCAAALATERYLAALADSENTAEPKVAPERDLETVIG